MLCRARALVRRPQPGPSAFPPHSSHQSIARVRVRGRRISVR